MIREEIIIGYIKGKDVLDVGGVGQNPSYNLWDDMRPHAGSLTGIDLSPSENKDIILGNMENHSFDRKFDVIVLGDVIEHVDNQGLLLDNIRRHLKEEGVLIVTTPNAKWPTVFMPTNPTHTLCHDKATLCNILKTHGFNIVEFKYYYGNKRCYNFLVRPLIMRQQMLAVCKLERGFEDHER
ncbi:MAG: class I SAM-dependent methyltransferase [Candidatus Omnitrophica bacterium]|nr:class I SAM-dependent methyltransferase [Candidatus Omnitrophota bacterium]